MKNDNCESKKIEMVNVSIKLDTRAIGKMSPFTFIYFQMANGDSSHGFDLRKSKGVYKNDNIWINKGFQKIVISGPNLYLTENVPPINDNACFCFELTKKPKIKKEKKEKPAKKEVVDKK